MSDDVKTGWLTYPGDARDMVDGASFYGPSLKGSEPYRWFMAIDAVYDGEKTRVEFEEVERT